jgi:hypothetical protein
VSVIRCAMAAALCLLAVACSTDASRDNGPRRQHENNPPSIGFIDIPANGATVDPMVRVSGWAADESGIKVVRIYFDDELMVAVPLVTPRPDINKAYPKFAKPDMIHGFESRIDAGAHAGYTTIRAEAIDGKGGLTQLYSVTVKIRD